MAKCTYNFCGERFNRDQVENEIDNYYGIGRYRWACHWAGGLLCYDCANKILYTEPQVDEDGNEYEVDPEDVIYPGLNDQFIR